MIRSFERTPEHPGYSRLASTHGRIPIIAVSASLVEQDKQIYIDAGFDGWILKPIDFKRLNTLLTGIHDDQTRRSCLYAAGSWEHGGWFQGKRDGEFDSSEDKTPTMDEENKEMPGSAIEEPAAEISKGSDDHTMATVHEKTSET